ncbi:hypothetical protein O3M35_005178 [Rhynocoris fuscipes]|uniref:BRO1 domain-containing protein n=1 Tax=Rhynocoris fuscipes TaxID=488301 RepID=A0AAW1DHB7_9HEMI
MEAVPRLPMISFELKISPSQPPVEFSKLKQYIREFYNEDPETYSSEIRNLEALRANAVRPVKDVTGCSVLKRYFCQLHFLQSRFPMGKGGAAAISFAWKDLYGGVVVQTADIKFEMVAILYNIGALHSQLGANDDRTTPEGLKMACTHFQCAAWSFQHLKDTYHQPSQMDLSPDLMQFMYHLCLAQAQECILEKSMTDNRKATINAKVAAQIVDYYNLALNALLQSPSPDEGILIDIVGTKNFKSWKKYMRFKAAYYSCVSLLYQGMQSEEQQKMGERVSYYQGALDKLNEAIKLSKGIDHSESVASACSEALVFTRDVVEGKRKAAKNENDFIYHEEIPELDSLPNVKGASLVKGISFSVNDPEISGPDIFARLVPMKAHEASSLYSEEKAKLLRKISSMIDSKDEELVSFMSCLQLEYIKAHLEPVILPQEVVDRCAALSAMPDAIPNLIAAMDKLNDAYHEVDGMLKEAMELIKEEEKSEKEYQELMGPRPPSIVATDLTREANKYMEAHKKAAESNETLHRAMTQHIENLRVLQQPLLEIQASLPNVSSLKLEEDRYLAEVILLVNKVGEMRRQRAMLASQLRESLCSDDITGQLVTRSDEKPEDIFAKELQKHDKYTSLIEQNLAAQDNIIRALTEAYANYAPSRKATTEIMRQRDMMLSALISSYDAYEDLIAKSSKGQEFYRKLETNLTKLLQRLKGTCKVQQEERETILAQNVKKAQQMADSAAATAGVIAAAAGTTGSSNLIPSGGGGGLKLKDYLQNKKSASSASPQAPPSAYYSSTVTSDTTPPQQSWLPGVRPAPVGSEGTAPVCTGSSKPSDYSSQVYNSMPNAYGSSYTPQSSSAYYNDSGKNYLQPSNYYYNSLYNTGLQSLQYPTISDSTLTQGVQDYNQNPYGYQQGTGTAASAYNYDHSYALSNSTQYIQNQSPSPSPSHTAVSNQSATQNSLSRDYSQLTSGTSNLSNQNYYGSHQSMPSHNGQTFSSHSYTQPVQVSQTYAPQPSQLYSQSQIFTQAPSQPTQTYSTPQSYTLPSSQEQSYPQQSQQVPPGQVYSQTQASTQPVQTYPQTQVSSSAQQQLGQPYSQAQSFLPQSTQPVQSFPSPQTSQTSVSQQPAQATQPMQAYSQPLTTQTQSIPSQSAQPLQNYSQSQVTLAQNFSQQPTLATQSYSPAHSTQAQTYVPASQPVGQEYTQATNAYQVTNSTDYSAYYSGQGSTNPAQSNWQQYYNYYNANQGAHQQPSQPYTPDYYNNSNYSSTYQQVPFQKTPGIDTSHYTRAGSKDSTLETNSSSVSPQGYTYASQYVTTSANGGTTYPQSYYVQPYGYNYTGTPTIQPASPAAGPDQAPNTNNITYMQAKTTKDNTSTTFSKQPPSNVDLLAGLDFSLKEPPLQPQQPAEKLVNKMSDLKLTTESNSSSVESVDPPKLETAQKSDINSQVLMK